MTQIEQIKAEIERLKKNLPRGSSATLFTMECKFKYEAFAEIEKFIESLSQEQPKGLDEAEFQYAAGSPFYNTEYVAFQAGAKWMAEQGVSIEQTVIGDSYGLLIPEIPIGKPFNLGDKVIVKVRRKDEAV